MIIRVGSDNGTEFRVGPSATDAGTVSHRDGRRRPVGTCQSLNRAAAATGCSDDNLQGCTVPVPRTTMDFQVTDSVFGPSRQPGQARAEHIGAAGEVDFQN